MAEFHFLRPWWFALLPVGAWLIWQLLRGQSGGGGWRSVVEAQLREHVLAEPAVLRESRSALIAALCAWVLGIVALAGPAWERLPVPAFRSYEALVVALDLSRSMDAADVEPTRLARAKLKFLDLLERRAAGQTALVVFSTHAFTVTPLTTDTRTIASLVGAVFTDIMPTQGGSVSAGLQKAGALLRQTGVRTGEILLITDSEVAAADLDLAGDLRAAGFRVSVLAVGTEQGAPIARAEGGFLTDGNGQVVIPQVDAQGLQRLATRGGGRFARLTPNDRDLDTLFPEPSAVPLSAALDAAGDEEYEADVWRDRGLWLVLLVLPLLALSFRRGWICLWVLWVALPAPQAEAFEWQDLWQRSDQRGYEALQAEQAERAAELFNDPEWRGAAQYRAGGFAESAATLGGIDTAQGQYNRGNALAKSGQLQAAIGAYDRALELDPEHADARYNRDVVQQYLEENPEPEPPEENQSGQQNQDQQGQSQQDGGSGEQQDGEQSADEQGDQSQGQQGENGAAQAQNDGSQEQSEDDSENPGEDSAQADNQDEAPGDDAEQGAGGPEEDVEQWASEQAAEQWLRRVPQDPGGLLRRKFLYQYQRLGIDQDGNSVLRDGAQERRW
jgi:Ca-activated chloride channel family protein